MRDDVPDLLTRRDIHPDLQLAPLAALGLLFLAALAALLEAVHRVHANQATLLHIGQHGAEGGDDLSNHLRRTLLPKAFMRLFVCRKRCQLASAKIVRKLTDHRRRQVGKPVIAEVRVKEDLPRELSADMTPVEIIETLNRLPFRPSHGELTCCVVLDRGSRDFLVASVAARCQTKI